MKRYNYYKNLCKIEHHNMIGGAEESKTSKETNVLVVYFLAHDGLVHNFKLWQLWRDSISNPSFRIIFAIHGTTPEQVVKYKNRMDELSKIKIKLDSIIEANNIDDKTYKILTEGNETEILELKKRYDSDTQHIFGEIIELYDEMDQEFQSYDKDYYDFFNGNILSSSGLFGNTEWCDMSIVYEYLKGLGGILQLEAIKQLADEGIRSRCAIMLVSGTDIPIQSPKYFTVDNYKKLSEESFNFIIAPGDIDIFKTSQKIQINYLKLCTQWHILSLETAKKLYEFYTRPFFINEGKITTRLFELYNKIIHTKRIECPDEQFIFDFLKETASLDEFDYKLLTVSYVKSTANHYSPIEWSSWGTINLCVYNIYKKQSTKYLTLVMALLLARCTSAIVFRKIIFDCLNPVFSYKYSAIESKRLFTDILWSSMSFEELLDYSNIKYFIPAGLQLVGDSIEELELIDLKSDLPSTNSIIKKQIAHILEEETREGIETYNKKREDSSEKINNLQLMSKQLQELFEKHKNRDLVSICEENNYNTKNILEVLQALG